MKTLGETIKDLREERQMSQEELAAKVKVSRSAIGMWENGKRSPDDLMKQALCDIFNVDMNYLYGKTVVRNSYRENNYIVQIPLYESVSCGTGGFADDKMIEMITLPEFALHKGQTYFAMIAKGDSMIGSGINDGDITIFEKTSTITDGQIGCFCIDDNNAVCKKFYRDGGSIRLQSTNDQYKPIVIQPDNSCFRCIGLLAGVYSNRQGNH